MVLPHLICCVLMIFCRNIRKILLTQPIGIYLFCCVFRILSTLKILRIQPIGLYLLQKIFCFCSYCFTFYFHGRENFFFKLVLLAHWSVPPCIYSIAYSKPFFNRQTVRNIQFVFVYCVEIWSFLNFPSLQVKKDVI